MAEKWFRISKIPDLTLREYDSLGNNGVNGVLERHDAFLRQLNRRGILSKVSFHLYYLYYRAEEKENDSPGNRLEIFLLIKGNINVLDGVSKMIKASPLADYYCFSDKIICEDREEEFCPSSLYRMRSWSQEPSFQSLSTLAKAEVILPSENSDEDYYLIREWKMNKEARLYNMIKMMEALDKTALYRVDLYPIEISEKIRSILRRPVSYIKKNQESRNFDRKDYEGRETLKCYEDIQKQIDTYPHFFVNISVMTESMEDAATILDAAGSEALLTGKYSLGNFVSRDGFDLTSMISEKDTNLIDKAEGMVVKKNPLSELGGVVMYHEEPNNLNLHFLANLFTLEEISPFFRFPALYEGEIIQKPKETEREYVDAKDSLNLGKDENGYDVNFKVELLPKHAFISGVPGSGKTNAMLHMLTDMWKRHSIPFLVMEPAKHEYRALLNDQEMKDVFLFSPNADMSFPIHINPFEMARGTMISEHIARLCDVFKGAFPMENPMPFLLDEGIEEIYRELGWKPSDIYEGDIDYRTGKKKELPTISMLSQKLRENISKKKYSAEVRGNLEAYIDVRLGSLLTREMGDIFDVPFSTLIPEKWLEHPAIIELEAMGSGPANFTTLLLCALIRETLKVQEITDKPVRHVIIIEEAHNLIGSQAEEISGVNGDPKSAATSFIVKMLAEVRALKEGIIIADQLPTTMAPEVIKNTGLKIGLRITSADDRQVLGSTMSANGVQLEHMGLFQPGQCLVFYEGLKKPFPMQINKWKGDTKTKNDIELRNWLENNEKFQFENLKSIDVYLEKYDRDIENIRKDDFANLRKIINHCDCVIDEIERLLNDRWNRDYVLLNYLCRIAETEHQYLVIGLKMAKFLFDHSRVNGRLKEQEIKWNMLLENNKDLINELKKMQREQKI